jgi:hypothetical protein
VKEFEIFVKSTYEESQKDVSESNQLFETLLEKYFERDPEDVDFNDLENYEANEGIVMKK